MIFFSNQCTLINNNNQLSTNLNHTSDRRLSSVTFSAGDIAKIIQNFNSNKAHGHKNISFRMLRICGDTINKPSELIFKQAFITGTYPSDWKKGNIVTVHKNGNKQNIESYRPVSLLSLCRKILKIILFNPFFANALFLYPLKTSETLWYVFRG